MNRRLKISGSIVICCFIVLTVTGVILLRWMNGSATGTVHIGNPQATQTVSKQEPVAVATSYFATELPGGFSIKQQTETPGTQLLLRLEANTSATQDEQFAATVGTMPGDGFSGIGDYNLRLSKPTMYAKANLTGLPTGATAFHTTSNPAELTVFWPHDSVYVELAFSTSGGANETQLEALYSEVLGHWAWR